MKWYTGLVALMVAAVLTGCGDSGVDENKPIEQVAVDAAKMGQEKLQSRVTECESLIAEKAAALKGFEAQIKELSISELMGEKAKTIKTETKNLTTSLNTLKERLAVYAKELSSAGE